MKAELWGWGRYPRALCRVHAPRDRAELARAVAAGPVIARGAGRAYGDAALQPDGTVSTRQLNRFLVFDAEEGLLTAEAGVMLSDILEVLIPRGWFPPVTPGSKFVTLGGMIAADVHGKNHHRAGSFGAHVAWVEVMGSDGEITRAHPGDDLFERTIGGMGLTGVIVAAQIRMKPISSAWIAQETIIAPGLAEAMAALEEGNAAEYSVAWIDCLATGKAFGRSVIYLGEHATPEDLPPRYRRKPFQIGRRGTKSVPLDAPNWLLNRFSARAFNWAYYRAGQRQAGRGLIDWDRYFYPLDAVYGWNKLYGGRGFAQYQCALPLAVSEAGLTEILEETSRARQGAFLSVLKRFGPGSGRGISFPIEGYTLTMDFPMTVAALALMDRLDRIVERHGGRLYLAKDSRMRAGVFHRSYGEAGARFAATRDRGFASLLSERLDL